MIDLHLHSRCSDGSLTPTELVSRAKTRGVTALALTDHDTCEGNEEAVQAGLRLGVRVIRGVEFSVNVLDWSVHILAYGVDRMSPQAEAIFSRLRTGREDRLTRIVARLNDIGIPLSSREVREEGVGGVVGRLHIARALVRRRYVESVREAFASLIGRHGRAYVERVRLEPEEAFPMIRSMGGVAVLAHPGVFEREYPGRLDELLSLILPLGLDGIEAHYSQHNREQTAAYERLAQAHGLIVTGGSDFHRHEGDGPEIGRGNGDLRVPPRCLDDLDRALAARRAG